MESESHDKLPSGAKARYWLMLFAARLKPCPFKATVVPISIPNAIVLGQGAMSAPELHSRCYIDSNLSQTDLLRPFFRYISEVL
jgi:hypothetical protein